MTVLVTSGIRNLQNTVVDIASMSNGDTRASTMFNYQVDANSYGLYSLLYLATDGNLETANAGSSTTMSVVCMALETGTGVKRVLRYGFVRNTSWSWTVGAVLFASATAGIMTEGPLSTDDFVQPVAKAWTADIIEFNPSLVIGEL